MARQFSTPAIPSAPIRALSLQRLRQALGPIGAYAVLVILAAIVLIPFMWMISTSLKSNIQILEIPPGVVPRPFQWHNYVDALTIVPYFTWWRNTLLITGANVVGHVSSALLAGYGFARLRFRGREQIFVILLITMLLPYQVTLIPQFLMYARLGWVGTYLPLIVPSFFGAGGAFYIFLLRQYFRTITYELDEAARIDGANTWQILFAILLPLLKPPLTIVAVFSFTGAYNDFLAPLIYIQETKHLTLAVGMATFVTARTGQWNIMMAAAVMMLMPLLIIYYFSQRLLIGGIASVGLKG